VEAFRYDETVADGDPITPDADPTEIDTEDDATADHRAPTRS
jgi:hypothetical protein